MNIAILLSGYTLTAISGAAGVMILARGPLSRHLDRVSTAHPGWAQGLVPAGWGAMAAFLFNDSGAVPAIFIIGPFLAAGLILLFWLRPFAQPATLENASAD